MENSQMEVSKFRRWSGIVISTLVILFMLFDCIMHYLKVPAVVQGFQQMGYALSVLRPLSVVEFIAIVLYIIPQTSVLGAILLTGYLGGAVDCNVRAGYGLFSFILAPVYIGILMWLGLWLRDARISNLLPLKK